jgi:quaternary ammonium compound-resistance protein SugE
MRGGSVRQRERPGGGNRERLDDIGDVIAMSWIILFIAGVFEIGWAVGLKYTNGFTRPWPTVGVALAMTVSVALLAQAVRTIPLGTAYAVWTGIGAVGTALLGMYLFGESTELPRILCLVLVVAGIVGLKFYSAHG